MKKKKNLGTKKMYRPNETLPEVQDCLGRALVELQCAVSSSDPQSLVNAALLLTTASRSIERESFQKMLSFIQIDGPETIASCLVEDTMELTFDHTLEAIGHITVLAACSDALDRNVQLEAAEAHASLALGHWTQLKTLNLMPGPGELQ